ncbi:MAG TPA: sugar transferase, partial [Bryobacteraceae bacterium]|nr:sugar transferase [Bryobacteraceae bacterium]
MIRVFSVAIPARILTLVLTETGILFGCYFFAAWIDPDIPDLTTFVQFDSGLPRVGLAVAIIMTGLYFRDLYSQVRMPARLATAQELVTVFGMAFIGQGLVHYVDRDLTVPRKVMLIGSPLALAALIGWRIFFDAAARDVAGARRILFVGLSPATIELAAHLQSHPELGTIPVGYISNDRAEGGGVLKRLGGFADLDEVIAREEPRALVIARREEVLPTWTEEFLELDFGGVGIEEVGTLYERTFGRVSAPEVWPPRFIVSDAFEPDETASRLQAIYSPMLAVVVLVVCSPILLLAALLIRLTSRGPVLERESRAGRDGVPFSLYRFRTEGVAGGALLRRFGIENLPQLLNVLAGSMAMVGPAPERPEYVEELGRAIPF